MSCRCSNRSIPQREASTPCHVVVHASVRQPSVDQGFSCAFHARLTPSMRGGFRHCPVASTCKHPLSCNKNNRIVFRPCALQSQMKCDSFPLSIPPSSPPLLHPPALAGSPCVVCMGQNSCPLSKHSLRNRSPFGRCLLDIPRERERSEQSTGTSWPWCKYPQHLTPSSASQCSL